MFLLSQLSLLPLAVGSGPARSAGTRRSPWGYAAKLAEDLPEPVVHSLEDGRVLVQGQVTQHGQPRDRVIDR
jgi:hypothetical protein